MRKSRDPNDTWSPHSESPIKGDRFQSIIHSTTDLPKPGQKLIQIKMGKVTLACLLLLACVVAEISSIPLIPHYGGCNHLFYPGYKCLAGSQYNYNYCGCHKAVVTHIKIDAGKGCCISRADPSNARAYLLLDNAIPTRMWCAPGTVYSVGICGCTHAPKAPAPEAPKPVAKPEEPAKCLSSVDASDATAFIVNVHGVDTQMFCAPGTAYSQADCGCSVHIATPAPVAAPTAAPVTAAPEVDCEPAAVVATGPVCNNVADPSDHRAYFVVEHGKKKKMMCAPGSLYSSVTCACGVNLLTAVGHHIHAVHPLNCLGTHGYNLGLHGYHGYPGYLNGLHGYGGLYTGCYNGIHGYPAHHGC